MPRPSRWPMLMALTLLVVVCVGARAADGYEPDNAFTSANPIATDGTAQSHTISPASDVDYVRFYATTGARCVIETRPTALADVEDTVLTLFAADGKTVLAENDDGGEERFSRIEHTFATSGTHYVRVRSYAASHTGGYLLSVRVSDAAVIRGTVTRAGRPAEGVAVWARPAMPGADRSAAFAITEPDGSYAIAVDAGAWTVSAHRSGATSAPAYQQVTVPGTGHTDFALSTAAPALADGVETCRAVLVGISDYAGSFSDLDYCDDDALALAQKLAEGANWRAENMTLLLNGDATRDAIWAALQRMATVSDADDLCLFFFSGHGTRGPDLPPIDEADGRDEYLVEANDECNIRDDELGQWLAELPTHRFIGIIASCYSGGMIESSAVPGTAGVKGRGPSQPAGDGFADDLQRALASRREMAPLDLDDNGFGVVITAADHDETCRESAQLRHDVLVYYLLEGMRGAADTNSDGWISAEEAYAYASPRATEFNPGQHAQIYDASPNSQMKLLDRNPPPPRVVTITEPPSGTSSSVQPGESIECTVRAAENFGGPVSYVWSATTGSFDDASSRAPTWTAPANDTGADLTVTISVTARSTEQPSAQDTGSFAVTVLPGQRGDVRIIDGPTASPATVAPGEAVACAVTAEDGLGDGLTLHWQARTSSGTKAGGFSDAAASSPAWTAPGGARGVYFLSVTIASASDPAQFATGAVEVRVAPRLTHTFDRGVQMVAAPGTIVGGALAEAPGASRIAGWDAAAQRYTDADPPEEAGMGCWARFDSVTTARVLCAAWPEDAFTWPLRRGWNLVALPWNERVPLSALTTAPSGAAPLLAWSYFAGGYDVLSGTGIAGIGETELRPWRSYWLYAREPCAATIRRPVAPSSATLASSAWALRLVAESAAGGDGATVCGVSDAPMTVPDLPAVEGVPDLALEGRDGALAVDLRAEAGSGYAWPLKVSATPGERVTVRCPDLSPVPADMRVSLEDRESGRVTSLRTSAGYSFTAAEAPRRLVLRVEPGGDALVLGAITAQQTGAGAAISFTLSAPAHIAAEVVNIAGRRVRSLVTDRACAEGVQVIPWNVRSDGGSAVPAGRYLVRVTARSESGEAVSAIAPLNVRRSN